MIVKKNYKEILNKIQFFIFYLTIIELVLVIFNNKSLILSLFKKKTLRELQNSYNNNTNNNNNPNKNSKSDEYINPIILIFFIFYVFFLVLAIYIIVEIKKLGGEKLTENIRNEVWKYIYMANSGFFIVSVCYSPMLNDLSVGYLALLVSGTIFVIGTIFFLRDFFKNTVKNCCEEFDVSDILKDYFMIPCESVCPFIGLTDPCCRQDTYTETTYSDGTKCSTEDCVKCWNCFILAVKRIILFISFVLFYAFFISISIVLLIIKLIHLLCKNCCCKKNNKENNVTEQENHVSEQYLKNNGIQGNNVIIHYQQPTTQYTNNNKMEINSEFENDMNQVKNENQNEEININKNENINISNNQVSYN